MSRHGTPSRAQATANAPGWYIRCTRVLGEASECRAATVARYRMSSSSQRVGGRFGAMCGGVRRESQVHEAEELPFPLANA